MKYYQAAGTSKGWGRLPKQSVAKWVTKQDARSLSYQVFKYLSRDGWTFRDLLRCVHVDPKSLDPSTQMILRAMAKYGSKNLKTDEAFIGALDYGQEIGAAKEEIEYLDGVRYLKTVQPEDQGAIDRIVELIRRHNFTREFLPTWALNDSYVWIALLTDGERITMPYTALIRNLGTMTVRNLFNDGQLVTRVANHMTNDQVISKSKIHPATIAIAWKQYMAGRGNKGSQTWLPVAQIVEALEQAITKAFGNVQPTGKRILHCFDGSGSMTCQMGVVPGMSSAEAVGLLGLVCSKTEHPSTQKYVVFSSERGARWGSGTSGMRPVPFTPGTSLRDAAKITQITDWGCTNISLPIERAINDFQTAYQSLAKVTQQEFEQALANNDTITRDTILSSLSVFLPEAFVIYTDNDVNCGKRQPSEALKEYRQLTGIPAKMAVVATQCSYTTVADPKDTGMLDFSGFDSSLPSLLHDFLADEF
jgi:60 kDa SS-A/Ro ribonucleoprotein